MSAERNAHILKLVARGEADISTIAGLPKKLLDLVDKVNKYSTDFDARENFIKEYLLGVEEIELRKAFIQADPTASLDDLEPPGYKFSTFEETYQDLPPYQWAIKGLFPKPSLSIIFGSPKSLKTMFLLDAALCIASGERWLTDVRGNGGFETGQGPIVWLDLENGPRRMAERISAFGRARGLPAETPFGGFRCLLRGLMHRIRDVWGC